MKPWLTDPLYGGMSEEAAKRSYDAWVRQGSKPLAPFKISPKSDAEIDRLKRNIEAQVVDYEQAVAAAVVWMKNWRSRRPRGFRAMRDKGPR